MMNNLGRITLAIAALGTVAACSSTTGENTSAPSTASQRSNVQAVSMDVTDIDYGSVRTDQRYLVSYSFPDAQGRFAVQSSAQVGASEPVSDTSDYKFVNDDVAGSIVCGEAGALRKLNATPDYLVADRAYQSTYSCSTQS